jgi:Gpi18-like mannosyltransferase
MTRVRKQDVVRRYGAPDVARRPSRLWLIFWVGVAALALWFRISLITSQGRPHDLAPAIASRLYAVCTLGLVTGPRPPPVFAGNTYPGDHDDFVRWGIQATDRGVLSLYDEKPAPHDMRVWDKQKHTWGTTRRGFDRLCNYPPLSVYLLYGSGLAFRALRPDRLINTPASLGTFLSWSILGDLLVAAGCAALVSLFRRGWAPRLTFLLALFLPPLWWDSVIWGQMDSVLLAPIVWMLYAMVRERWLLAGVLWGIAFGLKPQAILFIPLWGLALFTDRSFWRVLAGGVLAAAVFFLIGLPFTLHSGVTWFDESYRKNFALYADKTTLKAFNFWYLHLLLTDSLDAQARFLGLTRSVWGKLFLLLGLLASFLYALRYWRHDRRALVLWTLFSVLLFVMVPTEVHERYLILVLPFLGIATALAARFWPALLLLVFVMVGQLSWPLWLGTVRGHWPEYRDNATQELDRRIGTQPVSPEQRKQALDRVLARQYASYRELSAQTAGQEWTFTVCALIATAAILAAWVTLKPQPPPAEARPRTGPAPGAHASTPG